MQIEVKKTHIRRGKKRKPSMCPIALAIKESLGVKKVSVEVDTVQIGKKTFNLPDSAVWFVETFDECKSFVEPFEFSL